MFPVLCTKGASSCNASSGVKTASKGSYCISINFFACSRTDRLSAAIKQIASPKYLVISPSPTKTFQSFTICPNLLFPGMSFAVNTALTPLNFCAFDTSIDITLARGYAERTAQP